MSFRISLFVRVGEEITIYKEMQGIFLVVSTSPRKTLRQRVVLCEAVISGRFPSFLHTSCNNLLPKVDVKMGNDGYIKKSSIQLDVG